MSKRGLTRILKQLHNRSLNRWVRYCSLQTLTKVLTVVYCFYNSIKKQLKRSLNRVAGGCKLPLSFYRVVAEICLLFRLCCVWHRILWILYSFCEEDIAGHWCCLSYKQGLFAPHTKIMACRLLSVVARVNMSSGYYCSCCVLLQTPLLIPR